MEKSLSATIITIPLVYYRENLYWGLYTEYSGKVRNEILSRKTAGKQIAFAFNQAILSSDDIVIVADDKFNFEKSLCKDDTPPENELRGFLLENPLPRS